MMKIALAVAAAAAVLATAPLVTPVKAVEMAQGVDVQIGRDREDRYDRDRYDRDRRQRFDSDTTVGIGPGGVTVGPRQRCRIETPPIEHPTSELQSHLNLVCRLLLEKKNTENPPHELD